MAGLPSDFDVVAFGDQDSVGEAVGLLIRHPLVRSVTQQRVVTRFLRTVDSEEDEDDEGDEEVDESERVEELPCVGCKSSWLNGRRSLFLGTAFCQYREAQQQGVAEVRAQAYHQHRAG